MNSKISSIAEVNSAFLMTALFEGHLIRAVGSVEAPRFLTKEICEATGINKHHDALNRLPDWAKGGPVKVDPLEGRSGGSQEMSTLTEAGVYFLLMRSNKPEAERFQRWLCTEVLPQIRKQGFYVAHGMDPRLVQVRQGRQLLAKAAKLRAEAEEIEDEARALLNIDNTSSAHDLMADFGQPTSGPDFMRAARKLYTSAKAQGVPVGLDTHGKSAYPRDWAVPVLGLNQLTMLGNN